jgi:hypothetical protein
MANEQTPDGHHRVVVGIDGSESSKHALRWAQFIARATGATLEAVSAWQPYTAYGWMAAGWAAMPTDWNPAQDTEKALTTTIDELFGAQRPAGLQLTVRKETPPSCSCKQAKAPKCSSSVTGDTAGSPACSSAPSAAPAPNTRPAPSSSCTGTPPPPASPARARTCRQRLPSRTTQHSQEKP